MEFKNFEKMKTKKNPESFNSYNQSPTPPEEEEEEEEDIDEEEFDSINNQIDQLNNALDELERKNDGIHAQLVQLLETNRQAREQFQQMQNQNNPEVTEHQNPS